MPVRMDKPWMPLTREAVAALGGELGVYEIQDAAGQTVCIGHAGGRSLFGLRSALEDELRRHGAGHRFRCEVHMQYLSRVQELLMAYAADHGELPVDNRGVSPSLGRLHPA